MDLNSIIQINNVTKIYKLYSDNIDRLKESLSFSNKNYHNDFYALKNINFEVLKGESIGIIGKNGSGKSTLLKLIVGVIKPTYGEVNVNGKVAALLELGAGFNPEYTGLENIFLQGTIFGIGKDQMKGKLDEIINFADIGEFINQPVKNYSSGMFARLAFAVSINVEPDILIIDEALSVGDIFFQNKCFKKMEEIKKKGTTIIFVSHDLYSIKQFCDRAIWLEKGIIIEKGEVEQVCSGFQNSVFDDINRTVKIERKIESGIDPEDKKVNFNYKFKKLSDKYNRGGTGKGRIISFSILDDTGKEVKTLKVLKKYKICMLAEFYEELDNVILGFSLESKKGIPLIGMNTFISNKVIKRTSKEKYYNVIFEFELPKIQKGEYIFSPAIAQGTQDEHMVVDWVQGAMNIFIENQNYNISLIEIDAISKVIKCNREEVDFIE
jgi:ABC-type polysaccharide/polyol phosphate transport system ATPase subunit